MRIRLVGHDTIGCDAIVLEVVLHALDGGVGDVVDDQAADVGDFLPVADAAQSRGCQRFEDVEAVFREVRLAYGRWKERRIPSASATRLRSAIIPS